jgi:hypothetical protein
VSDEQHDRAGHGHASDRAANDRIERALEVFLYAPLGLGCWLRDLAPSLIDTVVARGRAEVDRRQEQAQQRITTARSMGEVALAFGVPELKKRAGQQIDQVREHADRIVGSVAPRGNGAAPSRPVAPPATPAPVSAPAPAPAPTAPATVPAAAGGEGGHAPARSESSAHLPIPGYDALSASQVVERLAGLGADDLASVRDYEGAHRNRRTILGKIDQLTS